MKMWSRDHKNEEMLSNESYRLRNQADECIVWFSF